MSTPTTSTIMHSWSDQPEGGRSADEWPYPTTYQRSLIEGGMADAIRNRLGVPDGAAVFITEKVISGGYSEYTQENDFEHTITVAGMEVDLPWGSNPIDALTRWLDQGRGTSA